MEGDINIKINISKLLKEKYSGKPSYEQTQTAGYHYAQDDRTNLTENKSYLYVKVKQEPKTLDPKDLRSLC